MRKGFLKAAVCTAAMSGVLCLGVAPIVPSWAAPVVVSNCEAADAQLKTVTVAGQVRPVTAVVDQHVQAAAQRADGIWVFPTIQQALNQQKKQHVAQPVIQVQPGTYREKIRVMMPNVTLVGITSPDYTTLVFGDAAGSPTRPEDMALVKRSTYGQSGCPPLYIHRNAVGFKAINMTFANDYVPEDHPEIKAGQALAMRDAADKSCFYNCRFTGRQDTLCASSGRQYYKNCDVEGDVDFIFGEGTCVFDDCDIVSVFRDTTPKGFLAAPGTPKGKHGVLFQKCRLKATFDEPGSVYLGRPWHPSSSQVPVQSEAVFRECEIGPHINADGWYKMYSKKDGWVEPTSEHMFEYKNKGEGAVKNANRRQLTDAQAKNYTMDAFFEGWKPEPVTVK